MMTHLHLTFALALAPLAIGAAGQGAQPNDGAPAAQRPAQTSRPVAAPGGKTFQHPNGFTFQHPADWRVETRVEDGTQFVQVVPAGGSENGEGYRILVAPTALQPTDRAFENELEQHLGQGAMRRVGAAQPFKARGGQGAVYTWDGTNPQTGETLRMRVYAVSLDQRAVLLFAVGPQAKVNARDAALLALVSSLGAGHNSAAASTSPLAKQWDQKLRGQKLTYLSSYNSGGRGGGVSGQTVILLGANGQFDYFSESLVTMHVPGASGSSGGRDKGQGSWRITTPGSNAVLELQFNDGRVKQYELTHNNNAVFLSGRRYFVTRP